MDYIKINIYFMNLENSKQLSYKLIYSLKIKNLEILKTYIIINMASSFIKFFKFDINDLILFISKNNKSLRLYNNYLIFNNLIIKILYLLLIIRESFNYLNYIKKFI